MNTQYLDEISRILQQVRLTQLPQMEKAARMLADATLSGHNLFVFGCNHAGLLAMEMYYRTGGMVNINPVRGPGLHLEIVPATMTSPAVLNAIMCRTVELIMAAGQDAPVFMSANTDGGDEYNKNMLKKYADHIFYM